MFRVCILFHCLMDLLTVSAYKHFPEVSWFEKKFVNYLTILNSNTIQKKIFNFLHALYVDSSETIKIPNQ